MNTNETIIKEVNSMKRNPAIMGFVTKEAYTKVASDIRGITGSGTTAKAVEILCLTNTEVKNRVNEYIAAGLMGCLLARYEN